MSQPSGSIRELLLRREIDYLMGGTRVKMLSSLENIDAGEFKIENLKEGETAELPRWAAEELVQAKVAEAPEEPFEAEILKSVSREKMMGPLQLSSLPQDFYLRMRRRLLQVEAAVREGKGRREEYERLKAVSYDLIGMRLGKLLSISSSSTNVASLGDRTTPEEREFFATSQSLSKEWRAALLGEGV